MKKDGSIVGLKNSARKYSFYFKEDKDGLPQLQDEMDDFIDKYTMFYQVLTEVDVNQPIKTIHYVYLTDEEAILCKLAYKYLVITKVVC